MSRFFKIVVFNARMNNRYFAGDVYDDNGKRIHFGDGFFNMFKAAEHCINYIQENYPDVKYSVEFQAQDQEFLKEVVQKAKTIFNFAGEIE